MEVVFRANYICLYLRLIVKSVILEDYLNVSNYSPVKNISVSWGFQVN